jgi:hypothetical protein
VDVRNRRLRIAAVVIVALVVGLVAWLLLKDDDDSGSSSAKASLVGVQDLRDLSQSSGHPIYWAGRRPGERYELTETSGGNIYIRYLPSGVEAGVPRPDYLTVGTYPFPNAYGTLRKLARRQGSVSRPIPGNGILVSNSPNAQNAYFAYRGQPLQIEVYDPQPGRAFTLIRSGEISTVR